MSGQDVSVPGRAGEEKIDRVEGGSDGRLYVMRCRSDKWGQISGTLLGQPHLHMNFRETCRPRATPARCPPLQQLMTQAPGRPGVAVSSSADCGGANQWGRHFGTKPSIWMGHDLFPAHMAARVSLPGFNYGVLQHCSPTGRQATSRTAPEQLFLPTCQDELESNTVDGQPSGSALVPGQGIPGSHPATTRLD